jgi:hypothetical protein
MVEDAKLETNIKEKKKLIKEIERLFDEIMSNYPSLEALVEDAITRILIDN